MRDKGEQNTVEGQLSGADWGAAFQLARLIGVDGLAHLTDDEAERLIEWMNRLADEGFCEGWHTAMSYTSDVERLMSMPRSTEH